METKRVGLFLHKNDFDPSFYSLGRESKLYFNILFLGTRLLRLFRNVHLDVRLKKTPRKKA